MLAQLSIWEWDGAQAKPLLAQSYEFSLDYGGFHMDRRIIRIKTKEPLEVISSSSPSPDPWAVWTIRIAPDGVQDLGRRFLQPEIKWADELLSKSNHKDSTVALWLSSTYPDHQDEPHRATHLRGRYAPGPANQLAILPS